MMHRLLAAAVLLAAAIMPAAAQTASTAPTTTAPGMIGPATAVAGAPATAVHPAPLVTPQPIEINAGIGRLVLLPRAAATVLAANPSIARAQPASPTSLFLIGVAPGKTTVMATAEDGALIAAYNVTVLPGSVPAAPGMAALSAAGTAASSTPAVDVAAVQRAILEALPRAAQLHVTKVGQGLRISGIMATPAEAAEAVAIVRAFGGSAALIDDLTVLSSIQVNVRVRVAEISRQITRELGFNWQALGTIGKFALGLRTGAAAGQVINALAPLGGVPAPDSFGAVYKSGGADINGIIDALATDQLISILAEPNLTAQSGETASFLAGGEFPIPVAGGPTGQITVAFKQFGISLSFVPTVLSTTQINLRVGTEVSQLSNQGAVSLPIQGGSISIPALTVRRAQTTVELGSGQSFAIAGLLQHTSTQSTQMLPGLGEVPVLGALFKSDQFQRGESELVIIVTPYLVRPASSPDALASPTDQFEPATSLDRILYNRQLARGVKSPIRVPLDAGFILH
jgi:pilus assembly protein CpaC